MLRTRQSARLSRFSTRSSRRCRVHRGAILSPIRTSGPAIRNSLAVRPEHPFGPRRQPAQAAGMERGRRDAAVPVRHPIALAVAHASRPASSPRIRAGSPDPGYAGVRPRAASSPGLVRRCRRRAATARRRHAARAAAAGTGAAPAPPCGLPSRVVARCAKMARMSCVRFYHSQLHALAQVTRLRRGQVLVDDQQIDVALEGADDELVQLVGGEHGLGVNPGPVLRYDVDDVDPRRVASSRSPAIWTSRSRALRPAVAETRIACSRSAMRCVPVRSANAASRSRIHPRKSKPIRVGGCPFVRGMGDDRGPVYP